MKSKQRILIINFRINKQPSGLICSKTKSLHVSTCVRACMCVCACVCVRPRGELGHATVAPILINYISVKKEYQNTKYRQIYGLHTI